MSKGKPPRHLNDLLAEMYRSVGMKEAYDQFNTLRLWDEIVGETIAKVTRVEQLREGDLYVRVKSPSWRMELNFRKKDIVERLNRRIGREMIRTIIFR